MAPPIVSKPSFSFVGRSFTDRAKFHGAGVLCRAERNKLIAPKSAFLAKMKMLLVQMEEATLVSTEMAIQEIIVDMVVDLHREDLTRTPLCAFSSAHDPAYMELKEIIGPWHQLPTDILPDAESVISYFIPFTKAVSQGPKEAEHGSPIWADAYVTINSYFEEINESLVNYLIDQGYSARAIRATHNFDTKTITSKWSHRSAACIAGLGTFGINRMLITPKGAGGRFCTVITSAKLTSEGERAPEKCLYNKNEACGKCLEICPVGALSPKGFDKFACQAETIKNGALGKDDPILSKADICGKCISVCPYAYIN